MSGPRAARGGAAGSVGAMRRGAAAFAAAALAALAACGAREEGEPALTAEELRERVEELYERARGAGEDVPGDAYSWAKSDLERIGDWEYQVVRLDGGPDDAISARLNELGAERWEVFWMEREGASLRLFLKRPARSYLRMLPLSELSRLVPVGGSSGGE